MTWTLTLSARAKVSLKEMARAKAQVRVTRARDSPKVKARAKGKEKPVSQRARRIRNLIASVLFCGEIGHFAKDCDHRVRTVNEVNQAAPVSTPVSAVTDPHTLSHVYKQNISVEHNWILALTVDIHSCSHVTASNMRLGTISPHLSTKQVSLKNVGGDVLHHFGSKTECYVYRSVKFQVNYEVAPVARPILSVDMLTRKGVLVVFGVQGSSSFIQLPHGHKIPMTRENEAMVLNETLVDRRNMGCDLVAPVVPIAIPVSSGAGDEKMRDSRKRVRV